MKIEKPQYKYNKHSSALGLTHLNLIKFSKKLLRHKPDTMASQNTIELKIVQQFLPIHDLLKQKITSQFIAYQRRSCDCDPLPNKTMKRCVLEAKHLKLLMRKQQKQIKPVA